MPPSVLYLGDTSLSGAAAYLAGLMCGWGWGYDYVRSDAPVTADLLQERRALYVLSDYPAERFAPSLQERLLADVADGAGLIMCGGWESFRGLAGNWNGSRLAEALPVLIADQDDRVNCDWPVVAARSGEHPTTAGLPWESRPPLIGGFNRIQPKDDAAVVLEARHFSLTRAQAGFTFRELGRDPLLVVGRHGQGRMAALATDVAPHWVGPLVDWGQDRVRGAAAGAEAIEVGGDYARFMKQLLGWAGRLT